MSGEVFRKAFYYSRWFYCTNPNCRTTTIMLDEDRISTTQGEWE